MDSLCATCLSTTRRLFLLENLNISWFGFQFHDGAKVCWECKRLLYRIQKFRLQVTQAQLYLSNYDKDLPPDPFLTCLSNLSVIHKDSYDEIYLHENVVKDESPDIKADPDDDDDFIDSQETGVVEPLMPVEILFTVPGTSKDVIVSSANEKSVKKEDEKAKEATIHQIMTFTEEEMQQAREQRKSAKRFLKAQYKCESCIIEFTMVRTYNKHMRTKHSEKQGKFVCKICAQRFKKEPDVREHFLEHYRFYRCRECEFSHHKLNIVEAHYEANHETERVYPCLKCDEKFLTRRKRKAHVQVAHGEAATCHVCSKIFPNSLRLKRHLVSHADLPKMECPICRKLYNGEQNLASHMKRHEAREKDPPEDAYCAECDVRFKNRTRLNWHLRYSRRHASEERLRYQCDECGKKFGRRFQIENHIDRDHVKILKYPCDQCDQKFLSSLQRRYHVQRFHEMRVAVKKRTTCKICGKEFAELVFKSALLCFECRAILRRVSDFKRNVSAVLEFFCNYQCDQRLPPPLSRLGVVNTSDEICVEHEVKLEQEVQEDSQLKEGIDFEEIEFLKDEFTDGDSDEDYWQNVNHSRKPSPKPALLVELDQRSSTSMQPASPQTEEDAPAQTENWNNTLTKRKRTEHKYIRLTERSFCLDKLVTRFSVNHVELERLFEKDRQDELFLALPYRCEACACGWRLKKNLDLHNDNRHSESAGPYQCDICTRRMGLNRICLHVKTHYVARKCNMCDYKTATQSSMRRHILKNHNKTVECQTCGAFLRSTRDFYYHYRTLHRRFICDHCGQSCLTRDAIKKHLTVHGPYICCGRQFRSYRAFKDHEAYHTKAQPDLCYCVECDKQFKNVLRFRKHLKTAKAHRDSSKQIAPREKVPCPECGKVYARAHTMRNHFNLEHLRRSKYKCEECDLYLRDSAMYRRHMLVNHKPGWEAPRDKICPECGRGFTRNEILKRHIRMHTGERPYKCVLCDAAFTQSSGLQKHVKHIHFKEKRKQAKIKKIKVKKP